MARARNIKPGFFKNEDLAECSPWARLCFAGLWTLADREGRLEDRPKRIKGELFAFDSIEVDPLLDELAAHHFIQRYAVNGQGFIQIIAFAKHQNPHHREAESEIPPPESPGLLHDETDIKPEANGSCKGSKAQDEPEISSSRNGEARGQNRADSLIPDSLIPDSLIPDSLKTPCAETDESIPACKPPKPKINYETGKFENLSTDMIATWAKAFPAIDVRQEIAKAKSWLLSNPKNRKSDINRFLNNWLTKAQDNAPRANHATGQHASGQTANDRRSAVAAATYDYEQAVNF